MISGETKAATIVLIAALTLMAVAPTASAATGTLIDMQYSSSTNLDALTPLGASQITQIFQQAIADGRGNDSFYWTGSYGFPDISSDWSHKCGYNGQFASPSDPHIFLDTACVNGTDAQTGTTLNGTPNTIYECISALYNQFNFYFPDQLPCIKYVWNGDSYVASSALVATTTPQYCTPGLTPDCNDNVLFLPGMGGSRLYRAARPDEAPDTEHQLWEPAGDTDAAYLGLGPDGSTSAPVYTRDVMNKAYSAVNIYQSFTDAMNTLKTSGKINDWEAVPYDWRLSLDQILSDGLKSGDNISYTSASSTPYIIQELKRLAASSRTGKVTIVAHSNGGLVTKALLIRHPELNQYVDRIIFVAVPQVGTPQAIASLLHGSGLAIPFKLSDVAVRNLGQNAPVAYNLLPSFQYFSSVSDPVVSIDPTTLPDWTAKYGSSIILELRLKQFLDDTYQRVAPQSADIVHPTSANAALLL